MNEDIFSIGLLLLPFINLLLLCVVKDARCTKWIKIFQYLVFVYLLIVSMVQQRFFWKLMLCNFIALCFLMLIEKVYTVLINIALCQIVENVVGSKVKSSIYFISRKIYVITDAGYAIINYKTRQYISYDNYNDIPVVEKKHFKEIPKDRGWLCKTGDKTGDGSLS